MKPSSSADDQICSSPDLVEEARLESILLHSGIDRVDYADLQKILMDPSKNGSTIFITRIAKDALGYLHGFMMATHLVHLWKTAGRPKTKMMLLFDGWSSDPRELYQIDEVQEFCRGFLGLRILPKTPEEASAAATHLFDVLELLLEEDRYGMRDGEIVDPSAFSMSGGLWVISVALVEDLFFLQNGMMMRDIELAIKVREQMRKGNLPPEKTP